METRAFTIETREQPDGRLHVEGRPIVFGARSEDLGGFRETFAVGSLTKTLSERDNVGLLYSHDTASILASTRAGNLTVDVDDAAVSIVGDLDLSDPDVQRYDAKRRAGTVTQMSFGFQAVQDRWSTLEDGTPLRTVVEARLFEVSAVAFPAYPATSLEGRGRVADLPVGALATMPAEVRRRLLDGAELSKDDRRAVAAAVENLRALLDTDDHQPDEDTVDVTVDVEVPPADDFHARMKRRVAARELQLTL